MQNLERLALSLAFVVMRTAKSHFFSTLEFYILLIIQKLVQFSSCILNQAISFKEVQKIRLPLDNITERRKLSRNKGILDTVSYTKTVL